MAKAQPKTKRPAAKTVQPKAAKSAGAKIEKKQAAKAPAAKPAKAAAAKPTKVAAKPAPAKKTGKAKKVQKGDKLYCEVCGLVVSVDSTCGCVACDIVCCGTQMQAKN